jgi:glycosyltransferase involved in cell wall biosynthesis
MVFEVRDLWPESAIDTGVLTNKWIIRLSYWLEKKSYKSANWINVLTPAFLQALLERKNIRPDRISMIPNAADFDIFKPGPRENWVREKHGLDNKFVITYIGAHGVANHLIQILECARILTSYPDIVFMLVGDGMQKQMLVETAKQWQLNNILFVNAVPKNLVVDYVTASDVCTAVLKKVDTFKTVYPNKVFDYMSAKKPIIVAIDGVARKLVEDASAGIYVEPENPQMFADAVLTLKNNPQLCSSYGDNSLNFVQKNFDRNVLAIKYLNILISKVIPEKAQSAVK